LSRLIDLGLQSPRILYAQDTGACLNNRPRCLGIYNGEQVTFSFYPVQYTVLFEQDAGCVGPIQKSPKLTIWIYLVRLRFGGH
jgi:hypothetical protein